MTNADMTGPRARNVPDISLVVSSTDKRLRLDALCFGVLSVLLLFVAGCQLGIFTQLPSSVDLNTAQAQIPFKIRVPTYVSPGLDPEPAISVQPYAGETKSVSILYESAKKPNRSFSLDQTDNSSGRFAILSSGRTVQIGGAKARFEELATDSGEEVSLQWIKDGVLYSIVATDLAADEAIMMAKSLYD